MPLFDVESSSSSQAYQTAICTSTAKISQLQIKVKTNARASHQKVIPFLFSASSFLHTRTGSDFISCFIFHPRKQWILYPYFSFSFPSFSLSLSRSHSRSLRCCKSKIKHFDMILSRCEWTILKTKKIIWFCEMCVYFDLLCNSSVAYTTSYRAVWSAHIKQNAAATDRNITQQQQQQQHLPICIHAVHCENASRLTHTHTHTRRKCTHTFLFACFISPFRMAIFSFVHTFQPFHGWKSENAR